MRNFINLADIDKKELRKIIDHAKSLKEKRANLEKSAIDQEAPLVGKTLILIFEQSSTRTRLSMEIAGRQLGMQVLVLNPRESHLGKGNESIRDTCKLLNEYGDICVLRTQRHSRLVEFAEHLNIPIINGLTGVDGSHPVQILGDVQSYEEVMMGSIVNQNISYLGDGSNNIVTSLIHASEKFGFNLRIACPKKYEPSTKVIKWAKNNKANILVTQDPKEAVSGSSCVYTDKWISMSDNKTNQKKKEKLLKPYQVNKKIMKLALPKALFFHCLPRANEVTDDVFFGKNSHVFLQAVNRIHIQKSILTYCLK